MLEPVASTIWSSWSVLVVIHLISKEVWSSTIAYFHSVLMISWSWPHMSWQLSPILFIWVSIQSLPLLSLQDALTLFLYFFCAVHMDMSSVSEQERQSPEAVSRSESAMFPLDKPESENVWSSVLFELPVTASSSGSVGSLVGLEEGLEDSCLCHMEPVLVSDVKLGLWSLPCVKLCSLPISTSGEVMQVLSVWRQLGESLGEWSCFPFEGIARSANGHPSKGVPARRMSGKEDTGRGEVPGGEVVSPDWPGTGEPWGSGSDSGTVGQGQDTMGMPLSCWAAMVAAPLM